MDELKAQPRHGGNLRLWRELSGTGGELTDFSANLNPLGPPEWLRQEICSGISDLVHYPDPDCEELCLAASRRYAARQDEIWAGNGTSELLYNLVRASGLSQALIPAPAYVDYAAACAASNIAVQYHLLSQERGFVLDLAELSAKLSSPSLVFIGQPNNPTGLGVDPGGLRELAKAHPESLFIVDEAFADFTADSDRLYLKRPENLAVLLSLTKIYALPGLRLGLVLADPRLINRLREITPAWSVNSLAQRVGVRALADSGYLEKTRQETARLREDFRAALQGLSGLTVYPGQANFLFCRLDHPKLDAPALFKQLLAQGLAIRVCADYPGLDQRYFRLAVRTRDENQKLLTALARELGAAERFLPGPLPLKLPPALMIQGASSNAGKSLLAAALCRIFLRRGLKVAPFKAQNMSLNSFVTRDGREMGRAQALQAVACRLDPDWRMNPVLLKPTGATGSQVIVKGLPIGNQSAADYFQFKSRLFSTVCESYEELSQGRDLMILEGAGSPAEVNLKSHDIVNMRMAGFAKAKVLIAADIDRGGAFASLAGTMELLSESERALVNGFILNRFRGDVSLLGGALDYLRDFCGREVLGVIPEIADLGLPEEDSVSFKLQGFGQAKPEEGLGCLEIAVIDLPHLSNFTDFDALAQEPDVRLSAVRGPEGLSSAQAVIVPGSKNTLADLAWLRERGLDRAILELAAQGKAVVGVCAGYQMLGERVEDPEGIESSLGSLEGLGLLQVSTSLSGEKTLKLSKARWLEDNEPLEGYEIHHGETRSLGSKAEPALLCADGRVIGHKSAQAKVFGVYLHGIFDNNAFRAKFLDNLRAASGLAPLKGERPLYDIEPGLTRLAGIVEHNMNIQIVTQMLDF